MLLTEHLSIVRIYPNAIPFVSEIYRHGVKFKLYIILKNVYILLQGDTSVNNIETSLKRLRLDEAIGQVNIDSRVNEISDEKQGTFAKL